MLFRYESEMTEIVADWLVCQNLMTKREVPFPWGICDLIGVSINKIKAKKRLNYGQKKSIGNLFKCSLLNYLPDQKSRKGISIEEIENNFALFSTMRELSRDLQELESKGFIFNKDNRFFKKNGWEPLHNRIVAVELKLNDFKSVFLQALEHVSFADEVYIAMPLHKASKILNSEKEQLLREHGIGLLSVEESNCRKIVKSKVNKKINSEQMYCVERFWTSFLEAN